jgi:hypothetical protein
VRIAAAGVDPFTLAYIFGWSDIRMAMRYTHATNANMKQAVRSLDSLSARLGNVLATKTKTAGASLRLHVFAGNLFTKARNASYNSLVHVPG